VWATRGRQQVGPYLFIVNHTTGDQCPLREALGDILKPLAWAMWPLTCLAWVALPAATLQERGYKGALCVVVLFVAALPVTAIIRWWRVRRFLEHDLPRLLPALAASAQDPRLRTLAAESGQT
jgi:hypothetical protein